MDDEVRRRYEWLVKKYKEDLAKLEEFLGVIARRHDELVELQQALEEENEMNDKRED